MIATLANRKRVASFLLIPKLFAYLKGKTYPISLSMAICFLENCSISRGDNRRKGYDSKHSQRVPTGGFSVYEDAYGETHEETVDLSTTIVKKVETLRAEAEKEPATKYPLWWLFLLVGLLAGGGAGFGIPHAIHLRKQRLQDEERL